MYDIDGQNACRDDVRGGGDGSAPRHRQDDGACVVCNWKGVICELQSLWTSLFREPVNGVCEERMVSS